MFTSSPTLGTMIDEVTLALQGFGLQNDVMATLMQPLTADDLRIEVDMDDTLSRGLVEVDEELIYVMSVAGSVGTIPPWGRGYKGTTKATHAAGSRVSVAPTWPRASVAREINNALVGVYPLLYAVKTFEFRPANGSDLQFGLPADAAGVITVESSEPTAEWTPVKQWDFIPNANTTDFPNGKAIAFAEAIPSNVAVRVTYKAAPSLLSTLSSTFASTGLESSSRDVIVLGAAARLMPWLDTGRAPVQQAEAEAMSQARPLGGAVSVAKEIRRNYEIRLLEERRALLDRYPPRIHGVR